ncbi:MAG: type II toxin-antitoxin system RelE/ParE family toxin [Eubacteriales bacterium]|nr:type II toxin-antitoxin system RelE/ParE family toxin [Eubacteriales bacterium]
MSYRLLQAQRAKEQLIDIALYIAEESGDVETALRVVDRLEEAMRKLTEMPNRGALPRDSTLRKQGHRVVVCEPYLIFYRCDDDTRTVIVTAVLHSRRDFTNLIF